MKFIRIILIVWGIFCLVIPLHTYLKYPIMKMPTDSALNGIELIVLKSDTLTVEEQKEYDFLKGWVLGNEKGLKESAKYRQSFILLFCWFISFASFVLSWLLRKYTLVQKHT